MKLTTRLAHSLAFKVGIIIVIAEILVLALTGVLYVSNFSNEIDRRIAGQLQLPGKLMQQGLLKFDSISDSKTMRDLVGEDLVNGLVIGTNHNVFFALNAENLGKNAGEIPGVDISLLQSNLTSTIVLERDQKSVSVSPVFGTDKRSLRFFVYVEANTSSAQQQKINLVNTFVLGSTITVILTSIILYVAFNMTVFSKLGKLLGVLKQVEDGNFAARITGNIANDEIGVLQKGINSMIGRLQEFVGTLEQRVRDRTRELEIARQQAEAASNTKSVFLSNMSHELRTPLNMIIGYSSSMLNMPLMYKNETLPTIYRDDLQLIQDNGKYLLGLINDILDLSKIEAEKLTLDLQTVELNELFRGVIATSLGLIKDKPLQISPDYPDNLPAVWVDPLRVRQILLNLMSNAIKFTESGTVKLSAKVESNRVRITVSDTGVGIPENALKSIFDRYEQIKNHVEGKHTGTGLGLDISQRLCQMHKSQLTVTSVLGQGSTFAFDLECATPEQIQLRGLSKPVADSSVKRLTPTVIDTEVMYQIVVAEHNSELRMLIRQTLENAGHVVVETSDGTELINLVQGVLPDAVITGVPLPSVDIWNLLETLKTFPETATIPVMALGTHEQQPQADKAGITLLTEPLQPETLLSTLTAIIEKVAQR
jgi:signal transduction histidine kinase/CheY-like chemotaxis protein